YDYVIHALLVRLKVDKKVNEIDL
nr:hypothetical protein [Tanacetum cinerariifolium]